MTSKGKPAPLHYVDFRTLLAENEQMLTDNRL